MDSFPAEHRWKRGAIEWKENILVRMTAPLARDQQFQAISSRVRVKINVIRR